MRWQRGQGTSVPARAPTQVQVTRPDPRPQPLRRLNPARVCQSQIERVIRTIEPLFFKARANVQCPINGETNSKGLV